jgi:hypothetical protein
MIETMAQADEEMGELFRQAWEVEKGYICDWPNAKAATHAADEPWARWNLDYVGGRQLTFAKPGARKFTKQGLIYINVFSPLGVGLGDAREASEVAIKAYEGKRTPGDVWFRNVRIESEGHGHGGGRNKSWWTTLVVAEFTYDHLR